MKIFDRFRKKKQQPQKQYAKGGFIGDRPYDQGGVYDPLMDPLNPFSPLNPLNQQQDDTRVGPSDTPNPDEWEDRSENVPEPPAPEPQRDPEPSPSYDPPSSSHSSDSYSSDSYSSGSSDSGSSSSSYDSGSSSSYDSGSSGYDSGSSY
jgi:hypothetical protein